jgi:hypothetical protein
MMIGRRRRRPAPAAAAPTAARGAPTPGAPPAAAVIPYEYAATFKLTGRPGNIVQDVINVGPDGVFVATTLSYGFEPERAAGGLAKTFAPNSGPLVFPGDIRLSEIPVDALIEGFRANPRFDHLVFPANGDFASPPPAGSPLPVQGVPADFTANLFEKMLPPAPLSFLFNFVDSGSGREMQDNPLHNIASLGASTGERPFRQLARPVSFLPRSNLRLQVIEQSPDSTGVLFIVLSGYMVIGATGLSEDQARTVAARAGGPAPEAAPPGPVIPFDYVTTFDLTGRPGNVLSDEIAINVEGAYIATSIGYGVALPPIGVEPRNLGAQPGGTLNLGQQRLRIFTPDALRDGIRIRASMVRLAFESPTLLNTALPAALAGRIFERLNRPEDISFRYRIHDTARGRDLQNGPVNNIAGLGAADGGRPFRVFTRPYRAVPRTTIRVDVEERNGRGRLYIVFHGYKTLGARG